MNKPIIAVLAALAVFTSTTGVAYAQYGEYRQYRWTGVPQEARHHNSCKNVNSSVYYGRTAVT